MNGRDNIIEYVNAFHRNLLSVDQCKTLLNDYASKIEGFVIYGAMQTGIRLKRSLESFGFTVLCFIDDVLSIDELDGLNVYHDIKEISDKYDDVCFLLSTNFDAYRRIMADKIEKYYPHPDILDQGTVSYCQNGISLQSNDSVYVYDLGIFVTNICNLKCKGCCTSTPTVPVNLRRHFPIDQLKESVNAVSKIVDGVNSVYICGGEPLLYPNLAEILKVIREKINPGQLVVPTNGTIVPSADVLESMHDNNVIGRVDDYGELSRNIKKVISEYDKWGIAYFVQDSLQFPWTDFGEIYDHGDDGTEKFKKCREWHCYLVYNGSLYPCGRVFRIHERELYEPKEYESIMLDGDVDFMKNKLKQMSLMDGPMYACRFCGMQPNKKIKAAEQME